MKRFSIGQALPFSLALFLSFVPQAPGQISPVRLSVSKKENMDTRNSYFDAGGTYRRQQVDSTVSYAIEVRNFSSGTLSNLMVKWTVLYDASTASVAGGGVSWSSAHLKVLEGDHSCNLGLGQKCGFDTDSLDLSSVRTDYNYNGVRHQYGGAVIGYCVEVFKDDKVLASEIQPPDTKQRIQKVKDREQSKQK